MRRPGLGAERLVGLFLIGAIGFSPPVLTLVNKPILVTGIPLLYLYLFGLWIALVLLARIVVPLLVPTDEAKPPPAEEGPPRGEATPPEEGPR